MRKLIFSFLCCVLLCGCAAGNASARAETILQNINAAAGYAALAEVCIDRGDTVERYTLSVKAEGDEVRVNVLAPEELCGVTAVLTGESLLLEYEGMVLDGASASPKVCAANCVPLAISVLRNGELCEHGEEDGLLRLACLTEDGLCAALCFDGDDVPVFAELEENGEITAQIEFTSFTFGVIMQKSGG